MPSAKPKIAAIFSLQQFDQRTRREFPSSPAIADTNFYLLEITYIKT